jgi:type VI secretion system protein ImpK
VRSGERFFDLLAGMQKEPGRYLPALEVCYLCLALGFRGKYRLDSRGGAEAERVREGLYQLLSSATGPWERELSPRWHGADAPHQGPGRRVPAWVIATVALALLALVYVLTSLHVSSRGDALQERLVSLPPAQAPALERSTAVVPPAAPPPVSGDAVAKFRQLLAVEIAQGLVLVQGDAQRLTIRVMSRGMFESGRAEIQESFVKLLQRIGEGLRAEPGQVLVVGHSDNQRIRTVQFPSNFELSTARAAAAMAVLGLSSGQANRFRAEGRADSEPVQANATAEGREANRRVEIVLNRAESR